jgi:glutaredoxin
LNITIYTSPTCQPCRQLKPLLFKAAVDRDWTVEEWNIRERGIPEGVTAVPTVRVHDGPDSSYVQFTGTGMIKDALGL